MTRAERVKKLWNIHGRHGLELLRENREARVVDSLPEGPLPLLTFSAIEDPTKPPPELKPVVFRIRWWAEGAARWPVVVADDDIIVEHLR